MDEEEFLIKRIDEIQKRYHLDIKPYVERLIKLRTVNVKPITIPLELLDSSILIRDKYD